MRGIGIGIGMARPTTDPLIAVPSPLAVIRESVTNFADWFLVNLTVNDDVAANYEGTGSADQTRSDATVTSHALARSGSALVSGVQYYADLVLKQDGRDYLLFQISGAGQDAKAVIDLTDNTTTESAGVDSVTVQDLSDGWKFVRLVFTATASVAHSCNLFHLNGPSEAANTIYLGDITKGLLLDRYVLSRSP